MSPLMRHIPSRWGSEWLHANGHTRLKRLALAVHIVLKQNRLVINITHTFSVLFRDNTKWRRNLRVGRACGALGLLNSYWITQDSVYKYRVVTAEWPIRSTTTKCCS